jgi:hypothetical protein
MVAAGVDCLARDHMVAVVVIRNRLALRPVVHDMCDALRVDGRDDVLGRVEHDCTCALARRAQSLHSATLDLTFSHAHDMHAVCE